jgi:hypothetical protein
VWPIDLLHEPADDFRSGGIGQLGQLFQVLLGRTPRARALARRANENGPLDGRDDVDQLFADGFLDRSSVRAC